MAIIFIIVVVLLIIVLFYVPKLLQKEGTPQQQPKPTINKHVDTLNKLFDARQHNPKKIITFRPNPQMTSEQQAKIDKLKSTYEVICLGEFPGVQCLRFGTEQGAAAIVRSLKPTMHIDDNEYESLGQFVNIVHWNAL